MNESVFTNTEKIIFSLRSLFLGNGYEYYRMRRFEEYELYSRNKDFLLSDQVIVFTDTNGKLMALKPDVTLSVIKNSQDDGQRLRKLCYNESVFRVSKSTGVFREILQTGVECIGKVEEKDLSEVLFLAAKSLAQLGNASVLLVSDLDILEVFLNDITHRDEEKQKLISFIGGKNIHEMEAYCRMIRAPEKAVDRLRQLLLMEGEFTGVFPGLKKLCRGTGAEKVPEQMMCCMEGLDSVSSSVRVEVDFSLVSNPNYYNGIIFKGFLEGIPESILSGGRYDRLTRKMGKNAGAVGFAVYLDALERIPLPESRL